jgi:hypothetical protein
MNSFVERMTSYREQMNSFVERMREWTIGELKKT